MLPRVLVKNSCVTCNGIILRAQPKHFVAGDSCLILQPESTSSHALRRWKGPAKTVQALSPNSYIVQHNGAKFRMHANNLRKFNIRVDAVRCEFITLAPTSDAFVEVDFECACSEVSSACAVVYESDADFGALTFVNPPSFVMTETETLPSKRIPPEKLAHLDTRRQLELFEVLDRFSQVFSDVPGLCELVEHCIPISAEFQPKRLKAYKMPEQLKAEVSRQISELLRLGFIEKSNSPMASPIVYILKKSVGPDGKKDVRVAIDYRYVNNFTEPSVAPLEDMAEIIQKVDASKFISLFDAKSGFHQFRVNPKDRWLTSFVCDDGEFQWTRTPFGMRPSGTTFVRGVKKFLRPIRDFS
jgi:hypothetical protein